MKLDLTVTISVILALCAIFSSVITAILNNRHQLKLKSLELENKNKEELTAHKREIFELYLMTAGRYIVAETPGNRAAYSEAFYRLLLFVPALKRGKLLNADISIRNRLNDARDLLDEVAFTLTEVLQSK